MPGNLRQFPGETLSLVQYYCIENCLPWQTNADMIFGGITVVCGILGTLAGGFVLDFMDNTLSNAFKVGICMWILASFFFMFIHRQCSFYFIFLFVEHIEDQYVRCLDLHL